MKYYHPLSPVLCLRRLCSLIVFAALLVLLAIPPAMAQGRDMTIIRDTEIENILKGWASPLIKAAGMNPASINIILVQNNQINAFVAGGQNIFIYTGLLDKSENAGEVAGVIAHELGHVSGGHLVRMRQAYEHASYESLLGTLLGIGVAMATGEGGAGAAISAGTQSMAARRFLSHSRLQESSADQAALAYLKQADISAEGMISFMSKLEDQDILPESQQSEYIRTHPLSRNRLEAMQRNAKYQTSSGRPYPPHWDEEHARLKAKLTGFIRPQQAIWYYGENDKSIAARYARAIAAYRQDRIDRALNLIDGLLATEPNNPYFLELKAQMLKDFGRLKEARPLYEKALNLAGHAPLIRIDLAHVLIETGGKDPEILGQAISHLNRAVREERRSTKVRRLLATAYGRMGQEAQARLQLAEEALLQDKLEYAEKLAKGAQKNLKPGSPEYRRASDMLAFIEQEKDKK